MTKPNGNKDLELYLRAWFDMMINIFEEKIIMLDVVDTTELYHSFIGHVYMHSGGDEAKINFAFLQYGVYVNAGVGKEVYKGNDGDLIDVAHYNKRRDVWELKRKPKPWFDKSWFRSIYAMRRDVSRIYGEKAAKGIVFYLNNSSVA